MKLARLVLTGIVVGSLLAVDNLAFSDPDAVSEAKSQLDSLHEQVSAIEQEAIDAGAKAEQARADLERAQQDLRTQEERVAKLSDEIGGLAVMQMQQGTFDLTMELLTTATDDTFLSSLATIQSETERSNASLQQLQNDQARLDVLRAQAEQAKGEMEANLATLEQRAEEYKAKEAEAQRVYDQLKAEEQERLRRLQEEEERRAAEAARREAEAAEARLAARRPSNSRSEERASETAAPAAASAAAAEPTPVAAPDGSRAQRVINAALAQVGKQYVMGTAGPNTFDCSGLTSYAYRQVGISLPRTSRAQYSGAGRAVSLSDIQPGDLVFYYSGPSHVGIYIGNGKIVHAANPRTDVNVAGLHSMPIKGVRRVL
ncbi:C40 family peptidase [Tessaracoccus oleiagri]|uniref:Cell wall-associated hydrolase, NlpC family n=1 Tax=Tessaracoccus oleiagri TaxID=686624 RepID=A0A1G9L0Y6_9ACTN|nr:C40 family peptidase [Tessaracoccus oleiagri]SDL55245.1 Cell wall-associated hydrolase, NlpC family [Tessaracoccus oleiagri]